MQGNPHKAQAYGNPVVDTPNKSVDGGGVVGRTLVHREYSEAAVLDVNLQSTLHISEARSYWRRRRFVYLI